MTALKELAEVVRLNNLESLKEKLSNSTNIKVLASNGAWLLEQCYQHASLDVAEYLLSLGVSFNIKNLLLLPKLMP